MSPGPATTLSPEPLAAGDGGASSPASTVNVKLQADGGPSSPGGDDVEGVSDNDDDVAELANPSGKRKRPISVS